MDDLISRSALIEVLTKYKFGAISNETEREYTKEAVLQFVQTVPTAYNVDKVVEELEKDRNDCRICSDIDEDFYLGMWQGFQYAIEIVKKGGVE